DTGIPGNLVRADVRRRAGGVTGDSGRGRERGRDPAGGRTGLADLNDDGAEIRGALGALVDRDVRTRRVDDQDRRVDVAAQAGAVGEQRDASLEVRDERLLVREAVGIQGHERLLP